MEHILGKISKIVSPIQRSGQDTVMEEWQIGDTENPLDTRFVIDAITLEQINKAMQLSNCGMVCLGGLTWRVQVRKGPTGRHYGIVKLNSLKPKPMSSSLSL